VIRLAAAGLAALLLVACGDDADPLIAVEINEAAVRDQTVAVNLSTCRDGRVTVEETPTEVRVSAEGRETGPTEDCEGSPVQFRLDRPLGGRPLIDTVAGGSVHLRVCPARTPEQNQVCQYLFTEVADP
jgi:hypothetical protein